MSNKMDTEYNVNLVWSHLKSGYGEIKMLLLTWSEFRYV